MPLLRTGPTACLTATAINLAVASSTWNAPGDASSGASVVSA
jgi:hypothetical protein